jgi:hypothetical protein
MTGLHRQTYATDRTRTGVMTLPELHLLLGTDRGDGGFRRKATFPTQVLRQV